MYNVHRVSIARVNLWKGKETKMHICFNAILIKGKIE